MRKSRGKTAKPGLAELSEEQLSEAAGGTIVMVNGGGNTPNSTQVRGLDLVQKPS